jgi:hypothetical protein
MRKVFKFFTIIFLLLLVLFASVFVYFKIWNFKDSQNEKIIDKEFHQEMAKYSEVIVNKFMLWEGDSMVTLDIPGKGEVSFWYGINKVPYIESIADYNTSFNCFNLNQNQEKISYAFNQDLVLNSSNPFRKWFSFQINNISDLITHYNDITKELSLFPVNPTLVAFTDRSGSRKVLKISNYNFIVYPNEKNKSQLCDIYFIK